MIPCVIVTRPTSVICRSIAGTRTSGVPDQLILLPSYLPREQTKIRVFGRIDQLIVPIRRMKNDYQANAASLSRLRLLIHVARTISFSGRFIVGALPAAAAHILPAFIADFRGTHP